jgi:hypothetical protein
MAHSNPLRAEEEDETMGEEPDGRFIIPFACAGEADYPPLFVCDAFNVDAD